MKEDCKRDRERDKEIGTLFMNTLIVHMCHRNHEAEVSVKARFHRSDALN